MKDVYRLEDLESRARLDAAAEKPARLAVIGWPVAHSASPRMHQPALDAAGIGARYIRVEIEPGRVAEAFRRMRELGFLGCNVTVPHKLDALAACDEVHPDARTLGAVNTVRFDADATRGFNTDGPGFAAAVSDEFGVEFSALKVAVIGAGGGAGGAIATQARLAGVPQLVVANRTVAKLAPLVERLREIGTTAIAAISLDDPGLAAACLECDLLVNTSSVGLKAGDPSILPAGCLRPGHLVYDTIYQPPVTPLLALARQKGCRTANGSSMLVRQGALAFQLWFPGTDPLPDMLRAMAQSPVG